MANTANNSSILARFHLPLTEFCFMPSIWPISVCVALGLCKHTSTCSAAAADQLSINTKLNRRHKFNISLSCLLSEANSIFTFSFFSCSNASPANTKAGPLHSEIRTALCVISPIPMVMRTSSGPMVPVDSAGRIDLTAALMDTAMCNACFGLGNIS